MNIASTPLKIGALGLLAAAVIGCGGSDATPEPTEAPTPEPAAAIEVIGNAFKYDPETVTISAADSNTIRLVNTDVVEHDYTITELDIKIEAAVGESAEATLTDVAPGTYRVFCTIPGHEAAGMVGSLVVTE